MENNSRQARRTFIKKSSVAGLGAFLTVNNFPGFLYNSISVTGTGRERILPVKPRYYRWHVDRGVEWLETNTGYAFLDWRIPLDQAALVLVDVWQRHYIKDTEARGEEIINNNLVPLLTACRKAGMNVIHCPSPPVARLHPNHINLSDKPESSRKRDGWPPPEFINRSGPYRVYGRPVEPREKERQDLPPLTFHPKVQPMGKEPVAGTGEELHQYCRQHGILFLFFAGFNTNACIISRDYGTMQMNNRGYAVVIIRDCTTGMESKESQPTLAQTKGAILMLEMFGHYSVESGEIITGLQREI